MKSLGMTSGPVPRAKTGDYERALQLAATFGSKDAVTKGLKELRDAAAALDKAREDAEAGTVKASERGEAALKAEAKATDLRQKLAGETAKARDELGAREMAVMERERLVGEAEQAQETRDAALSTREAHLHAAGVANF